jgi:hypothetical protein
MGNTFNTGRLINGLFTDANGNVGIGNTTPSYKLDVTGTGRFTSTVDGTIFNSTSNTFRFSGNNALSLVTLNSQSVVKINAAGFWGVQLVGANDQGIVINNTGNVGIGTNNASTKLNIVGGTSSAGSATSDYTLALQDPTSMAAGVGGSVLFQGYKTGTTAIGNFGYIAGKKENGTAGNEAGYLAFGTFNSSGIPAERMRISSGGDVTIASGGQVQTTGGYFRLRTTTGTTTGLIIQKSTWTGSGSDFTMSFAAEGGYGLSFFTNGNANERLRITTDGILYALNSGVDGTYQPMIGGMYSSNNNETNLISTAVSSAANQSGFRFDVSNGAGSAGRTTSMTINRSSVTIVGSLSKGSGSFKIEHPLESKKDTHHLVHSFVESPQANNIYRGKIQLINGSAEVNLDEVSTMTDGTFVLLNREIHTYTSNETDWDAVRGKVEGNILTIECQNTESNAIVSWLVIGERQDKHMMDTDWTDDNGKVIVEPLKISQNK